MVVVDRHRFDRTDQVHSGIERGRVDTAEAVDGGLHHRRVAVFGRDVGGARNDILTTVDPCEIALVDVDGNDGAAGREQALAQRPTDARGGAGHDGDVHPAKTFSPCARKKS